MTALVCYCGFLHAFLCFFVLEFDLKVERQHFLHLNSFLTVPRFRFTCFDSFVADLQALAQSAQKKVPVCSLHVIRIWILCVLGSALFSWKIRWVVIGWFKEQEKPPYKDERESQFSFTGRNSFERWEKKEKYECAKDKKTYRADGNSRMRHLGIRELTSAWNAVLSWSPSRFSVFLTLEQASRADSIFSSYFGWGVLGSLNYPRTADLTVLVFYLRKTCTLRRKHLFLIFQRTVHTPKMLLTSCIFASNFCICAVGNFSLSSRCNGSICRSTFVVSCICECSKARTAASKNRPFSTPASNFSFRYLFVGYCFSVWPWLCHTNSSISFYLILLDLPSPMSRLRRLCRQRKVTESVERCMWGCLIFFMIVCNGKVSSRLVLNRIPGSFLWRLLARCSLRSSMTLWWYTLIGTGETSLFRPACKLPFLGSSLSEFETLDFGDMP